MSSVFLCIPRLQADLPAYPLVFDIDLKNANAMRRLQYLIDGHYIDNETRAIDVQFITFNGERHHGHCLSEQNRRE